MKVKEWRRRRTRKGGRDIGQNETATGSFAQACMIFRGHEYTHLKLLSIENQWFCYNNNTLD